MLLVAFRDCGIAIRGRLRPDRTGLNWRTMSEQQPFTSVAGSQTPFTEPRIAYIPGGWFRMGCASGRDDEKPVHRVWVDDFRSLPARSLVRNTRSSSPPLNATHRRSGTTPIFSIPRSQLWGRPGLKPARSARGLLISPAARTGCLRKPSGNAQRVVSQRPSFDCQIFRMRRSQHNPRRQPRHYRHPQRRPPYTPPRNRQPIRGGGGAFVQLGQRGSRNSAELFCALEGWSRAGRAIRAKPLRPFQHGRQRARVVRRLVRRAILRAFA